MNIFRIEPGEPRPYRLNGRFENDLADGIQSAFPMETENAHLFWRGTLLPLNYKYDVSVIIEDVIEMMEQCRDSESNNIKVNFGSNTFNADWELEFEANSVLVSAQWNSVVGDCEARLNESLPVFVEKFYFFSQWLQVVRHAVNGVEAAGIRLKDVNLLLRAQALLTH